MIKNTNFNNLRDIVKEFNKHDDIFNYDDEQSNYEVANNIKQYIDEKIRGKKIQ